MWWQVYARESVVSLVARVRHAAVVAIDLLQLPSPTGSISAMVGDIGHVQALYRDGSSSNSTNALSFTVR